MKPATLLATLIVLAVGAGMVLHFRGGTPAQPPGPEAATAAQFVAGQLGLDASTPAPLQRVPSETMRERMKTKLAARFGPEGLAKRTRAYTHLTLLPPGQDLELHFLTMYAAGTRGWFDDHSGTVLVLEDFAPDSRPDDRTTLLSLRTREALHQAGFRLPPDASDDQWMAHHILHGAMALAMQEAAGSDKGLPSSEETEREAVLLSLPVFVLNLAQAPEFVGLPYLAQRRDAGTGGWLDLLRTAPTHSHDFFRVAPDRLPPLPDTGTTVLEESLGAYATQLLLERHSDYERAEALTPHWRGDRYRLFTNARGEHLVWYSQWATPEMATAAADILRNTLTTDAAIPGSSERSLHIETRGLLLRVLNCADPATLTGLLD